MKKPIKYASVCTGIAAETVAWHPLGWEAQFFSEIEPFPSAVLAYRWQDVVNLGDLNTIKERIPRERKSIDVLVGGTPCQSFSLAGLRKGMDDPRGQLMLVFLGLLDALRPKWVVWENVPGVLSSNEGRDFGTFLGGMGQLGYGFAYRVLDAQYFGVPQRRRRVFVVGYLGDWRRASAVLFERSSLSGDPAPRRKTRQGASGETAPSLTGSGRGVRCAGESRGQDPVIIVPTVTSKWAKGTGGPAGNECQNLIAFSANDMGLDAGELSPPVRAGNADKSHANGGVPPAIVYDMRGHGGGDLVPTLTGDHCNRPTDYTPIAIQDVREGIETKKQNGRGWNDEGVAYTLDAQGTQGVKTGDIVRRLTPRECERLQGFEDDYTLIPFRGKPADECPDSPRYKALGNAFNRNVMAWIGKRIEFVEKIIS